LPEGIPVSLIIPGNIKTAIWQKVQETTIPASPEVKERYGKMLQAMEKITTKMGAQGIPPETVAKVIENALIRKRPKPRYIVGMDAKLQTIAEMILPDRIIDNVFKLALGFNQK